MQAPKTLRRPEHWPNFEDLCKKLWGEIWKCPEIVKNGRNGQTQHGVDVYGIPSGETQYYGIQCKGKNEYNHNQITEDEIIDEIENAKTFEPPLKKLYIATTAEKDAKIEAFVRKKNVEQIKQGLFEVHLFSWPDIVDKIDENRETHDWYVKSQNFKSNKAVRITFENGLEELTINPIFVQKGVDYILKPDFLRGPIEDMLKQGRILGANQFVVAGLDFGTKVNLSFCKVYFEIHNTGSDTIEDYKFSFELGDDIVEMSQTNEKYTGMGIASRNEYISNVTLWKDSKSGKVVPRKNILVGDDTFRSDSFYVKPEPKRCEIPIRWKLLARDFKCEGELKLVVRPEIKRDRTTVFVEDKSKVRRENGAIEEYIIDKKEESGGT